jgi:Cof subfamily protein (haloacid dehalogenase superfamily)
LGVQAGIRLVALDLDGTTVGPDGQVSSRLVGAVQQVQARGVRVMLATGRMLQSAMPYWRRLGLNPGPVITYNGAVVAELPQGSVWYRRTLPDEGARALVARALAADVLVQVYVGHELWLSRDDARAKRYIDVNRIVGWVKGYEAILQWPEPPIKVLLQGEALTLDQLRQEMTPLAEHYRVRLVKSQSDYLEMIADDVGKGEALRVLAARLGLRPQEVMAIGDAENDLDMIRWAGLGVAMGQAPHAVKAQAKWVTAPLEEDGAARALEHWLLGDQ